MQDRTPYKHNTMQSYKEIWKDVPGYEGRYQVSNLGRVKSLRRKDSLGRIVKEKIRAFKYCKNGYHTMTLDGDTRRKTEKVHRLVLLAFKGYSKLEVNHINGVKTDNRLENLEYCNHSSNMMHARLTGLINNKGERSGTSKLSKDQVLEIRSLKGHLTQSKIAEMFNVSEGQIQKILSNKRWKHI